MHAAPEASHFVNGVPVEDRAGSEIPVIYPASGERIATVHAATPAVVDRALAAAEAALYAGKVTAYAQGMDLIRTASKDYDWNLNIAAIVRIWRAGCIIRAQLLEGIAAAFERYPDLPNLLLDDTVATAIKQRQADWRVVVIAGIEMGIPLLALAAALKLTLEGLGVVLATRGDDAVGRHG